jgi:hypothetical protein
MFYMSGLPAVFHDLLNAALYGLELQKSKVEEHIAHVRSMLGTAPKRRGRPPKNAPAMSAATVPAEPSPRNRRKMSTAARKRIAEAMKKRWAAAKESGRSRLG